MPRATVAAMLALHVPPTFDVAAQVEPFVGNAVRVLVRAMSGDDPQSAVAASIGLLALARGGLSLPVVSAAIDGSIGVEVQATGG
jgi:hypothetical protein